MACRNSNAEQRSTLEAGITGVATTAHRLEQELAWCATNDQVAALQTNCAGQADLDALQAIVDAKADKALLDRVSGGSSSALAALEQSLRELQQGHEATKESIGSCAPASALDALEQAVASKADRSAAEQLGVAQQEASAQVATLSTSLETLQACLATLQDTCLRQSALEPVQAELASKADKSELDRVSGGSAGALTDMQAAIASLQERLQQAATSTAVAEVTQRCDDVAASAAQQARALAEELSSKADTSELQQVASVATVAAQLERTVHDLQERVSQLPGTEALQGLEERVAGKASCDQAQELAEAVQAMQSKLKGVSGSEQMAEVQQRLDQLAADVAAAGTAAASSATVEELQAQVQAIEQLAHAAASQSTLEAVQVCQSHPGVILCHVTGGVSRGLQVINDRHAFD